MIPRPLSWLALDLILGLALTACTGQNPSHAIRRLVVAEFLQGTGTDDLVIRLAPGEPRENFGFSGETIFLISPVREAEFWEIHDPHRTYLFIKDIEYGENQKLVAVGIELYLGPGDHFGYTMDLQETDEGWEVVMISGPLPCPCPR